MSVNVMSLVFKSKIEDIKTEEKTVTAPLLKLIMLALADHCNDDGDGAYPSLTTLEKKTALTRKSVINSLEALKQQGLIIRAGISRRGTTNYSLNVPMLKSLIFQTETPLFTSEPNTLAETPSESGSSTSEPGTPELVNLVHPPSEPGTPELVNLVHPPSEPGTPEPSFNHPLTIIKPSNIKQNFQKNSDDKLGTYLGELSEGQAKIAPYVDIIERLSAGLHLNLPPYGESKEVDHVAHMIALAEADHPDQTVELFCAWATANKYAKELAWYRIRPDGIWGDWLLPYVPVKQWPGKKEKHNKTRDAEWFRKLAEA